MSENEKEGITTYCIEYANVGKADCSSCNKVIPRHSLRAGEIFRKSKSEKKKSAKHSWYHITCWKGKNKTKTGPVYYLFFYVLRSIRSDLI